MRGVRRIQDALVSVTLLLAEEALPLCRGEARKWCGRHGAERVDIEVPRHEEVTTHRHHRRIVPEGALDVSSSGRQEYLEAFPAPQSQETAALARPISSTRRSTSSGPV